MLEHHSQKYCIRYSDHKITKNVNKAAALALFCAVISSLLLFRPCAPKGFVIWHDIGCLSYGSVGQCYLRLVNSQSIFPIMSRQQGGTVLMLWCAWSGSHRNAGGPGLQLKDFSVWSHCAWSFKVQMKKSTNLYYRLDWVPILAIII